MTCCDRSSVCSGLVVDDKVIWFLCGDEIVMNEISK